MNNTQKLLSSKHILLILLGGVLVNDCLANTLKTVAAEIRFEALLKNNAPIGRPLPLTAHWNTGQHEQIFDPHYQMRLITQGNYLLPWFYWDMPMVENDPLKTAAYYQAPLQQAAKLGLPIALLSTQWERLLSERPEFSTLPVADNPNVITGENTVEAKLSPFAPVQTWTTIGKAWTSTQTMRDLQHWYPNPPLVLLISNNEHPLLAWKDAETDWHYRNQHFGHLTDAQKRQQFGDAWITHYRALQQGMLTGLTNMNWKQAAKFIGYDALADPAFGKWTGWLDYSLISDHRCSPWPLAWDGASSSYYVYDWNEATDYTVFSPQIWSMNLVFMLTEAYQLNPNFWFELSIWDGYQPTAATDKRAYYKKLGQNYNPQRYAGMVKFGMWLLHPRVVREFRNPAEDRAETEPYFLEIVKAVNAIHRQPTLRKFWRHGQLVPNHAHQHPYQANIPDEYKAKDRWFLLDADINPKQFSDLTTEIPVFALATKLGIHSKREWLIYLHSPLRIAKKITVTIPEFGKVRVDATPAGNYYHVVEATQAVKHIKTPD